MDYTEYPDNITESFYYFLRRRDDLHLRVFQVKQVCDNCVYGILEFRKEMMALKTDLIDFNPKSRLFQYMMRISTFKNDSFIKKALYKIKYSDQNDKIENIYKRRVTFLIKYKSDMSHGKTQVPVSDSQQYKSDMRPSHKTQQPVSDTEIPVSGIQQVNTQQSKSDTQQVKTQPSYATVQPVSDIQGNKIQYVSSKFNTSIRIIDSDLSLSEFEKAYSNYVWNDEKYIPDTEKNSSNIIVPGTKEINTFSLYKTISKNGGMENVTNEQKWKSLFFNLMRKTNVSYTVRTFYKRFLYEFEQIRRDQLRIECECKNICDCDDYVNTNNMQINCPFNFNYKFSIGEIVVLYTIKEKYYGHIKLRRNRGLNQYYIQFLGWCKEYSEWLCEDVLRKSDHNEHYVAKRPSRSSKSNNLVNDPLIREKHSHNKNETQNTKYDLRLPTSDQSKMMYDHRIIKKGTNLVQLREKLDDPPNRLKPGRLFEKSETGNQADHDNLKHGSLKLYDDYSEHYPEHHSEHHLEHHSDREKYLEHHLERQKYLGCDSEHNNYTKNNHKEYNNYSKNNNYSKYHKYKGFLRRSSKKIDNESYSTCHTYNQSDIFDKPDTNSRTNGIPRYNPAIYKKSNFDKNMSHRRKSIDLPNVSNSSFLDHSEMEDRKDAEKLLAVKRDGSSDPTLIKNYRELVRSPLSDKLISVDNQKMRDTHTLRQNMSNQDNRRFLDRRLAMPFRDDIRNGEKKGYTRLDEHPYRNSPTYNNSSYRENLFRENSFRENPQRDMRDNFYREKGDNRVNYIRDNHYRERGRNYQDIYNCENRRNNYNRENYMNNIYNRDNHKGNSDGPSRVFTRDGIRREMPVMRHSPYQIRHGFFNKKQEKIDFFNTRKNLLLNPEVIDFVANEKLKLQQEESRTKTKRELLKELYAIDGKDECIMNIHNYMIISYFKELR